MQQPAKARDDTEVPLYGQTLLVNFYKLPIPCSWVSDSASAELN